MRLAVKLCNSVNAQVRDHVYLNADLTTDQRKANYDLRTELKRCRAAGEVDLVIRNGKMFTKPRRPAVVGAASAGTPWLPRSCTQPTATTLLFSDSLFCFALLNFQSINNKSVLICNLITDSDIDIMVLTKPWHAACSDLPLRRAAPGDYNIADAPRSGHDNDAGVNHGGIVIIHCTIFFLASSHPHFFRHLLSF